MIKFLFLIVYIFSNLWEIFLNYLNLKYAKNRGRDVPDIFKDTIDENILKKSLNYLRDKTYFLNIEIFIKTLIFVLSMIYLFPFFEKLSMNLIYKNELANFSFYQSLIFFSLLGIFIFLTDLPFDIYFTFKLEKIYGFSNITKKVYIIDKIKIIIISILIGIPLLYIFILILNKFKFFFLPLSFIIIFFILIINIIYPSLILPLFYKFEKLEDDSLKNKILKITEKEDLKFENIYIINASTRSSHTNAFFSGFGKTKKIVFYDTLIKNHTENEILSIFAHELGHYKKGHIFKSFLLTSIFTIFILLLFNILYYSKISTPFYSCNLCIDLKIIYTGIFLSSIVFPIEFLINTISRKFEFESDEFAMKLTDKNSIIKSLKNIFRENLSNLFPHPLYSKFKYSHPPPLERILHILNL
jgi:STE24 endopeptidase